VADLGIAQLAVLLEAQAAAVLEELLLRQMSAAMERLVKEILVELDFLVQMP
jgi:hypothetical protein